MSLEASKFFLRGWSRKGMALFSSLQGIDDPNEIKPLCDLHKRVVAREVVAFSSWIGAIKSGMTRP